MSEFNFVEGLVWRTIASSVEYDVEYSLRFVLCIVIVLYCVSEKHLSLSKILSKLSYIGCDHIVYSL